MCAARAEAANGAGPASLEHARSRLAHVMLGDRASAEDVVQEAFCGLYRRWSMLADAGSAIGYVRSSMLNGCRSVLRRQSRARGRADSQQAAPPPGFSPRQHPRLGYGNITEFSVRSGKPVLSQDKFGTLADDEQGVLWASPDGSVLVVSDPRGAKTHDGPRKNVFGVLAGNKFTPIARGAHTFSQVAW